MMLLTKSEAKDFKPAPEGSHNAVCVRILDLGIQETNFGPKRELQFSFEIEEAMEDGRPFLLSRKVTAVMNEKSNLYKMLTGWFGKAAIEAELSNGGFSPKRFLGKPGLVNVSHSLSADGSRTFANIASVSPLPKNMTPLKPSGELFYFDCDEPDMAVLGKLPERLGDMVTTGLGRYQEQTRKFASGGGGYSEPGAGDLDDEIPF